MDKKRHYGMGRARNEEKDYRCSIVGSITEIRDGFLTVETSTSGSGVLYTDLDIYLDDEAEVLPSLLTLSLFSSDPIGLQGLFKAAKDIKTI